MNFKNLSFLLAFACAIPAYADEASSKQKTDINDFEGWGKKIGRAELAGTVLGVVPATIAGITAHKGIYNALAPLLSNHVARGIAMPGGLLAFWGTALIFQLPTIYFMCKAFERVDKSFHRALNACAGQAGTHMVGPLLIGVLPAVVTALGVAYTITAGTASLASNLLA